MRDGITHACEYTNVKGRGGRHGGAAEAQPRARGRLGIALSRKAVTAAVISVRAAERCVASNSFSAAKPQALGRSPNMPMTERMPRSVMMLEPTARWAAAEKPRASNTPI